MYIILQKDHHSEGERKKEGRGKNELSYAIKLLYISLVLEKEVKEIYSKWRQILSRKINSKFSIFIMQNKYNAGTSFS